MDEWITPELEFSPAGTTERGPISGLLANETVRMGLSKPS